MSGEAASSRLSPTTSTHGSDGGDLDVMVQCLESLGQTKKPCTLNSITQLSPNSSDISEVGFFNITTSIGFCKMNLAGVQRFVVICRNKKRKKTTLLTSIKHLLKNWMMILVMTISELRIF
jgi:hypothetical protein